MATRTTQVGGTLSMRERILKWGIVALVAILPLLYFPGRIASYVTSKQYFFIGSVEMLVVLWLWLMVSDVRYRLTKRNWLFLIPGGLFLLSLTISAWMGVDPSTSFFSTVESGTGLILLYHIFAFTCMTASVIRVQQKKFITTAMQAILAASVVLAIATFFTGANGLVTLHSAMLNGSSGGAMMGNVLLVGAYFIFSCFFAMILFSHEKMPRKKILYLISLAVLLFSPVYWNATIWKGASFAELAASKYYVLGEARIAAVALVIGALSAGLLWCVLQRKKRSLRTVGFIGIAIGLAVSLIMAMELFIPTTALHHFFVTQGGNRTVDWQESVRGIQERPIFGWGPENFRVVYQRYLDPVVFSPGHGNEVWSMHPHNNTLEVLINGGLIGFVLYLFMLASLVTGMIRLYRNGTLDRKTTVLLAGMLVAFVLQQQMIYDSIVSYVMFFFVIAIVAGLVDTDRRAHRIIPARSVGIQAIVWVVTIALIPVWFYAAYLPARKMEELQSIATAHSDQRISQYQHLFHSAGSYAINTDAEFYTDPLFYSYTGEQEMLKHTPTYQKVASEELAALLTAVDPVWQGMPHDYHLSLSLLQIENLRYYLTEDSMQLQHADQYAKIALALSPTDPQIYVAYAQTLLYEKNIPAARMMVDKALALSPYYQPAINLKKTLPL